MAQTLNEIENILGDGSESDLVVGHFVNCAGGVDTGLDADTIGGLGDLVVVESNGINSVI